MPWIAWEDAMSVGVAELDDEHKQLFGLLDEIYRQIASAPNEQALKNLVERIVITAKEHFAHEERLFVRVGYADAPAHYKEHDCMMAKALSVQANFRLGSVAALSTELLGFFRDWLIAHIEQFDKLYIASFKDEGIR